MRAQVVLRRIRKCYPRAMRSLSIITTSAQNAGAKNSKEMTGMDIVQSASTPTSVFPPIRSKFYEVCRDSVHGADFEKQEYVLTKPNSERALHVAETENLQVVFPKDNEIQIDIDNNVSFDLYVKLREVLWGNGHGPVHEVCTPSRSGNSERRHITVTFEKPVTPLERICLQACLGSDRMRELLGYLQWKNNDPHPTLFLEKK